MKKILYLLPLVALCLGLTACSDDDNTAKKYPVAVNVAGSDSINISAVSDITVECLNLTTGKTQTATVINNAATFNLPIGSYRFTVTGKYDNTNVEGVSQTVSVSKVVDDYTYNVDISLNFAAAQSSLIFKEVYFTGVPSYFFRDAFYEIVNNADTTVYLDGVILALVDPGLGGGWVACPSVWIENGITDVYPCTNYTVYFPGNGTEHPLAPGASVVVAASAQNHKTQHPANADTGDEASPVDLSGADWETFISTSFNDSDNPDVPNMELAYGTSSYNIDFMPAVDGKTALMLVRLPNGTTPADFAANADNYSYAPGTSYPKMLCIPRQYVIDAIDCVCSPTTERYKKLQKEDDRSYVFIDADTDETGQYNSASYCGRGLRRKVVSVTNGIAKYKDTNNSEADFITTYTPVPHRTINVADE